MNGIFYCCEVTLNSLLHRYVPVSEALSEEQIAPSLEEAVKLFLEPAIGAEVIEHLSKAAESREPSMVEAMALEEARRAAIHLALWFNFQELNTHFTDQGWKREEGDTYKSLYHYQEIDLRTSYRNKGFNALDRLNDLLQAGTDTFPEYKEAPAYIDREHSLVRGPKEIQEIVNINSSVLVFMALRPNVAIVQQNELQNVIGSACYNALCDYLADKNKEDREDTALMEQLRKVASRYVIALALARQMETVGTITDRGLYYESVMNSDKSILKIQPVPVEERDRVSQTLRKDAQRFQGRMLSYIERYLPELFVGRPGDAFNRNNDCKRTFWT